MTTPAPFTAATSLALPSVVEVCSRCGAAQASKFGDECICDDCYTACGSCCAEWFEPDQE